MRTTLLVLAISLVANGMPEARLTAVKLLSQMRDLESVPALILALDDPDWQVAVAADEGLQFIGRKINPGLGEQPDKNYLSLFRARDFESIEARLDPSLRNEQLRSKLEQVAAFFPSEPPKDVQTIGAHTFTNGNTQQFNLTFQYEFSDRWLLANVVLQRTGTELTVMSVNVQSLTDSLETIHEFTLDGKGPVHFIVLALAILIPLFVVATLVICARTPIPRRKWAWILFILLGLGQFSLNWTDGTFTYRLLSFELLGAGFLRASTFAPVILSISAPIGAIAFLIRRRTIQAITNEG